MEAIDQGRKIELNHEFPIEWLQVGHIPISNPILHVKLQSEHAENYSLNDGEFTAGIFCVSKEGVYTTILVEMPRHL